MAGNQVRHHLEKNDVFASYTIVQFCGSGAYGEVYLAEDITHKLVALKIIPISSGSEVWRMELIGLRHYRQSIENYKSLIEVLHVGETENFFYYTMEAADNMLHGDLTEEYVADTLAHRLERGGRLEPEKVLELANALLDALEHLAEYDLAHSFEGASDFDTVHEVYLTVDGKETRLSNRAISEFPFSGLSIFCLVLLIPAVILTVRALKGCFYLRQERLGKR